ncbi:MAG: transcriptional regulator [Gemmatimonadetes bacterium 13_2_20CM_69_27]|nr:MAG: transcriptional regulator [Gemmatimonadetes bacterium 13_2_20CM_69_27]OLB54988.1 MAG: transcriptional regulator [Gemmatimonadetes bacterium 13_2_20CM_2_69_23]OLD58750.1 MAG: transcriptional regulator [Gemmatimonadetes bacterium 13_1_20CM_69_28]PYO32810.1 MAG: transcriptional regulator [Gemmatimonadota bacterium]PYP25771.1 MAG: transcriptional regulator [Gemmatimonadota bacterium]
MRIGIDLGGTKIEAVALSRAGEEIARRRVATPRDYAASLDAIAGLVRELDRAADEAGTVGVGIPGTLVPETGLVKNANSVWLNGRSLGSDLEQRLDRPVRLMNDANCFALSEATDGAAAGAHVVFGVILGTGVGGGIVVDGRCLLGANLIAGEWGHNPLPWPGAEEWPGPPCYCGKRGCVEAWLSGPAFERDHAEHTGLTLSGREIVRAAAGGDPGAAATLARYQDRLGRTLASLINVLDPDVVVLGGGMSNIPGLPDAAHALLPRYLFAAGADADPVATRVVHAVHGDASGVRGAAWLWPASDA